MTAEGRTTQGGTRRGSGRGSHRSVRLAAALVMLVGVMTGTVALVAGPSAAATSQDWPTFGQNSARTSATTDANLSVSTASQLQPDWTTQTGGIIESGASVVGTTAYVGSWDGYEYAINTATGAVEWKTLLNQTVAPICYPWTLGVSSSATVVNGVVYVGSGGTFYALDPTTGAVEWSTVMADNSQASGHYDWATPLVVNGYAYVGIASICDDPVVQGELLKIDLTNHDIAATHYFVPNGQLGGGIWTTASYDATTNKIFVTNGNRNAFDQPDTQAIMAVDPTTLNVTDSWQIPESQSNGDPDFGTGPVLSTDAQGDQLVSAVNKNGILYTWNRNDLAAGPVWQHQIAVGGECPECGDGSISTGAYNNGVLYWAGGNNDSGPHGTAGSVTAFNAGTGQVLWTRQTDQTIIGSIAYVNGMVAYGEGNTFEVVNAATGALLYSYALPGVIYGPVTVAQSQFYVGDTNAKLYAFGVGPSPATPPADPNCPTGFTCQDIHNPAAGSESTASGTLTVTAAGTGIKGVGDQFRFLSQSVTGDSQESATLSSEAPGAGLNQQAGLMLRQSTAVGSPFYAVLSYPNDNPPDVQVWERTSFNANPTLLAKDPLTVPGSLMIQRVGNAVSAGVSTNGTSFQILPGSTRGLDLPATYLAGLAVDSGSATTRGTASVTGLTVGAPVTTTLSAPPPADPCPSPWTCTDLGNPSPIGDTTGSGTTLTLSGSGTGFGQASDSTHYAYQSVSGDASLSAQVVTQPGAAAGADEGLMMRASTSPTAPMYSVYLKPGGSATVQWRINDGVAYESNIPLASVTSPTYLEITEWQDTGTSPPQNEFSTLTSTDGVTWTPVLGSTVALSFGGTTPYLAGLAASSGTAGATTPVVFNAVNLTPLTVAPPGICPTGWSCSDVGGELIPAGNQLYQNGTWTVQGSGDIYSTFDEFHYVEQPFATGLADGDGTVTADVTSQSGGGPWMRSGVMIRSGTDPSAPYYGVFVTPSHGVVVQWRTAQGAGTNQITEPGVTAPEWVMASRYTDVAHGVVDYTAYASTDGLHWSPVPNSQVALTLPGPLVAGIASEADSSTNLATATFTNVGQQSVEYPPPNACPTGWSCTDIGGALPVGQDGYANGTFTESAGGGDIWGTADAFHLVAQSLAADGTVTAQVASQSDSSAWAKAGVMLRSTTDPGSPYYAALVTPGNGVVVQWRTAQGGSSSQLVANPTQAAPVFLRVGRYTSGSSTYYTAYTSPDGTTWTAVPGSTVVLSLPGTLLGGLALTSHNQGVAGTVTFTGVSVAAGEVAPPGLSCPTGWSCADIGSPAPAGTQSLASGTWTLTGGGADIFGTTDAFHYAWQSLAADGSLSARLVSLTSPSAWEKAGPMLRATTDPASPYYGVFATTGNGVVVQWRAAQGGTTAQVATTGTAPVYLRAVRTGTTFSAYTSPDGTTWTLVPGSTVTLPSLTGSLLRGLAVTSHSNGKTGTAVFDTVVGSP